MTVFCIGYTSSAEAGKLLDNIKKRGTLICGISLKAKGFAETGKDKSWKGFDADICRAVATSLFGDKERVQFVEVDPDTQYETLENGEVDLLASVTGSTFSAAVDHNVAFAPAILFDGQGFLAKKSLGVRAASALDGVKVCIPNEPGMKERVKDFFAGRNHIYKAVVSNSLNDLTRNYLNGACDVLTLNRAVLVSFIASLDEKLASESVLLPELLTHAPFAPSFQEGDPELEKIVSWTLNVLIRAEQKGLSQQNFRQVSQNPSLSMRRFFKNARHAGSKLGLKPEWAEKVVHSVGNYKDIYTRNFGPFEKYGLKRGPNKLSSDGGLIYARPFQ
ncbi:MAG: transporter substrate-binding domain-containing protein [Alphaproteobacteria bacterium]|nr:transporter substrate-binding domain-containing protein [Alphaproteobacteria bacterium]